MIYHGAERLDQHACVLQAGGQGAAQILTQCIAALPPEAATQAEQQKAMHTAAQLVSGGLPEQAAA